MCPWGKCPGGTFLGVGGSVLSPFRLRPMELQEVNPIREITSGNGII